MYLLDLAVADAEWDDFVACHPVGHFLQSSGWGRLRRRQGWRVARLGLRTATGRLVAGAQVQLRRSPLGWLGYVPRGPVCLVDDPTWPALAEALRAALGRGGVALRLEPHWADAPTAREWLAAQGLVEAESVQPPSTIRLDLSVGEAALLAGMKQKWRYNVRLAARHDVVVHEGGEAELAEFGRLMAETTARNRFHARPTGYYVAVWRALAPHARLYVARWSGLTLAAIFVVHFGDTATYLYGASSDAERQRMPNHVLQWTAIRHAQREGLRWYDLWGIPDALGRAVVAGLPPADVPSGRGDLWGVWGFKRGFGGQIWRAVGAWEWVLAPRRYALGRWLMRLRAARRAGGAGGEGG